MKRIVIGIVALFLSVFLCTLGFFSVDYVCNKIDKNCSQIKDIIDTNAILPIQKTEETIHFYKKARPYLGLLLNEDELDEADLLFFEINQNILDEDVSSLTENISKIHAEFQKIKLSEKLTLQNIL